MTPDTISRSYALAAVTDTGDMVFYTANPKHPFSNSLIKAQFLTEREALKTSAARPDINFQLYQLDHSDEI